jgi:hypothetical protein
VVMSKWITCKRDLAPKEHNMSYIVVISRWWRSIGLALLMASICWNCLWFRWSWMKAFGHVCFLRGTAAVCHLHGFRLQFG